MVWYDMIWYGFDMMWYDMIRYKMIKAINNVHPEVSAKYYGCGLVVPDLLEGCDVLDLGCGAGRDCYIVAQIVGERGKVGEFASSRVSEWLRCDYDYDICDYDLCDYDICDYDVITITTYVITMWLRYTWM